MFLHFFKHIRYFFRTRQRLRAAARRRGAPGAFSAVLMGIRMPVTDGLRAAQVLRVLDRPDAKTVPILAMTADAFGGDAQRCLDAGMNGHIAKPITPERLYEALGKTIKQSSGQPEIASGRPLFLSAERYSYCCPAIIDLQTAERGVMLGLSARTARP